MRPPTSFYALLILFLPIILFSQQDYVADIQHYGIAQGLPNNHIYQAFQDRRGVLWLIAENSLIRFDGHQFKEVMVISVKNDPNTNKICFEDQDGNLWIRNWKDRKAEVFLLYNTLTGEINTPQGKYGDRFPKKVFNAAPGKNRSIWVCNASGEMIYFDPLNMASKTIKKFTSPFNFFKVNTLRNLIWKSVSEMKIGESKAITLLDYSGKQIGKSINVDSIQNAFVNTFGSLCYTTIDDLGFISPEGKVKKTPLRNFIPNYKSNFENNFAMPIAHDPVLDNYWFLYDNKLFVFSLAKGLQYVIDKNNSQIRPTTAFSIFIDKQGVAWFPSIEGLYKTSIKPRQFQKLLWKEPKEAVNLAEYSCRGIFKDERTGTLYVNTAKCFWSIKDGAIKKIFCREQAIFSLVTDKDNNIFLGCESLYQFNPNNGSIQLLDEMPDYNTIIWSLFPQGDRVWLGGNNGIAYFDKKTGKIQNFEDAKSHLALKSAVIYSIQAAGNGKLWLVSEKGLFLFNPQKGIEARYWKGGKGRYHIPTENLRNYCTDNDGNWWLATGEGLLFWNQKNGFTRLYTMNDGLSNNNIYAVYPDQYGFLWLSSDRGIMQFQKKNSKIRVFLPQDGITHQEFNRISHYQSPDGTLYFGSLNGLTVFHPRDFFEDFDRSPDIPLILTTANLFSRRSDTLENVTTDYLRKGKLLYRPHHLYLTLSFALLDFLNPSSIQYEYRIDGFGNRWGSCSGATLQLAGLPYGKYLVEVRAKTSNGMYSRQQLSISIQVLRPFYFQWWFGLLLGLCCLGLGIVFFRYRNQWLKTRKAELEREVAIQTQKIREDKAIIEKQAAQLIQLDEAKSRFFTNVTHEFRTPIALILGPLNTYLERHALDEQDKVLLNLAKRNGDGLLQMINDLLDLSKLEVGKLPVAERPVLLYLKIRQLLSAFEGIAEQKNIDLQLNYEPKQDLNIILDAKLFGIILNNLLSNAFKFTPQGGSIVVGVKEDRSNYLQITLEDTGIGIHSDDLPYVFDRYFQAKMTENANEGGSGIGLALANESSKAMGGSISIESIWGTGSIFRFKFPKKEIQGTDKTEQLKELEQLLFGEKAVRNGNLKHPIATETEIASTRPSLLILEDNSDLQQYLKQILEDDYHVTTVNNGQEAQKRLEHTRPDLILSDIMMPLVDGFQFLEWMKNSKQYSGIPVIMLTARAEIDDKLRALRMGVDDYMLKPFVESELLARVHNLLQRQTLRSNYLEKTAEETYDDSTNPFPQSLSDNEKEWLNQLEKNVLERLQDPNFTVNDLAKTMLVSRTLFYTEVGRLIGLTPNEYVIEIRLNKAMDTLKTSSGQISIKEVANMIGFRDEKYFSRQFKRRFGILPSQVS
jgi:signal transduction histidine kinase/DNA-binding response OmpR family regulator/ligand-binding sensor domain-containing protein